MKRSIGRVAAAICAIFLCASTAAQEVHRERLIVEAERGDRVFFVEIADSPGERVIGLSGRAELQEEHGMLFLFDAPEVATFWMRDTHVALDIIFIEEGGRVLNIAHRTVPRTDTILPSAGPVVAVLEIRGGLAQRHGIGPGTRILHPALGGTGR